MIQQTITIAYIDASRSRQLYTATLGEAISIGKALSSSIRQTHPSTSDLHCQIRFSKSVSQWIVEDSGSSTGTYLNNERIVKARILNNNDRIRLGIDGPILSVGFKSIFTDSSRQDVVVPSPLVPTSSYIAEPQKSNSPSFYIILSLLVALLTAFGFAFFRGFQQSIKSISNSSQPELAPPIASVICAGTPFETEELYNRVKPTVVQIKTPSGSGSGVVIASGPTGSSILTNYHVVAGNARVTLLYPHNSSSSGTVVRVGGQEPLKDDLALINTSRGNLSSVKVSTDLSVGQTVFVLGSPGLGEQSDAVLQWSLTKGIVSNIDPAGESGIFQTDAGINPGNSGGPIFNTQGCLVGLAVAVPSDRSIQQVGFAITSESINSFLSR